MEPLLIAIGVVVGAAAIFGGDTESTFGYAPPSGGSYRFRLRKVANSWRAYILEQPSYGARSSDGHSTHRYYDSDLKQHYVCFDPLPTNEAEARSVAKRWAECNARYVRHGIAFPTR